MRPALFITLDGIDGTGKSTQQRLLADWLRGRGIDVVCCADPGGTEVGNVLRGLLLDHRGEITLPCEVFLFMASRAQLVAEIIRPALTAGKAVISDRFLLANVVYQGHAGGLDPADIWSMGKLATGGLEPDLTIVLDLPVEQSLLRRSAKPDRFESRALEYHERVRLGFLAEAKCCPERIRVVDAGASVEEVHARICEIVAGVVTEFQWDG